MLVLELPYTGNPTEYPEVVLQLALITNSYSLILSTIVKVTIGYRIFVLVFQQIQLLCVNIVGCLVLP